MTSPSYWLCIAAVALVICAFNPRLHFQIGNHRFWIGRKPDKWK